MAVELILSNKFGNRIIDPALSPATGLTMALSVRQPVKAEESAFLKEI